MLRALLALIAVTGVALAAPHGWTDGSPAANTAQVLAARSPVPVDLPAHVAQKITRTTFVFYFSPTCGHCQQAAPEIAALAAEVDMDFLGVASGAANPTQIAAFFEEYGLTFDWVLDEGRAYARAVGARSTPDVLVIEPTDTGFQAVDAYRPWYAGAGLLMKIRANPTDPFASFAPGVYQGRYACSGCHLDESDSWALTHHAIAYRTLYVRDRAEDQPCVGCHVAGLDEPTGFTIGDHASPNAGVTCEACHSAGGPHDGQRVDAKEQCVTCHDADHSIAFTVEKGLPHIDHYLAKALTDAEWQARFEAVSGGTAERPLLAFPEGKNLGEGACKSCHAEQHKGHKKSPHRQAMSLLEGDDATRVDCVRCHATPLEAGPEPTELSGFRVDEGVGCESCHGPGEAHAAAPTTQNIIGLGESCPECVIEEVCTSCHDKQWDPTWELKKRLGAVKH